MDWLRKITLGCRQHYEKIILSLVLLILGVAVWYLNEESKREKEKIELFLKEIERRAKGEIKPLDFAGYTAALRQAQNPPVLNFSLPHNLLNPVKWQRRPNNELIKVATGAEVGWPQMAIARVSPLNFSITMIKAPTPGGCYLGFTRESAPKPNNRLRQIFCSVNSSNRYFEMSFVLKELKGAPENPEATLELLESNEKVIISSSKPHSKIEGYEADLKYTVDGKSFNNLRVGSNLKFLGDTYNIIAISPDEVIASGLNDKKYPVRQKATP